MKKLTKYWYDKLKESGFEDIEQPNGLLKSWSSKITHRPGLIWETQTAYYNMAQDFLRKYEFAREFDRIVWEYHANGLSIRQISKTLKDVNLSSEKTSRTNIHYIVTKHTKIMKTRYG